MAAAVPLLVLTACAQTSGNTAAGAPASGSTESAAAFPQGANELVLRTESTGGFMPIERVVGNLPSVSVYGDGRVITDGPVPAIYPGRALPNVQVQIISPEQVRQLVEQGLAAGVRTGADFGQPGVADAPATRVTVMTADGPQTVTAEALNEAQAQDPRLTPEQRAARTRLAKYVQTLTGLAGAQGMPAPVPYDAVEVAVLAHPWAQPGGGAPGKNPDQAWPGPALPGQVINENVGMGCVVVTGAEKDKVLAAAKSATAITPWTHGGKKWAISFRPLLPDEQGCAALKGDK
jgi:hypothetical protein